MSKLLEKLFSDLIEFEDRIGLQFRFLHFFPKGTEFKDGKISESDLIYAWKIKHDGGDIIEAERVFVKPSDVERKTLSKIGVLTQLTEPIVYEEGEEESETQSSEEFKNCQRNFECIKCGKSDYIPPSILSKKLGEYDLDTYNEFVSQYTCSNCVPKRRGRQSNPLHKDVPKSTNCSKCGKECILNVKKLYEDNEGDMDKISEYCKSYLCRKCNPNWGSWLKGKKKGHKTSSKYDDFPKTAICIGCQKEIGIVPQQIENKATKLGITVQELLENYKCRSCGGRLKKEKVKK